MLLPGHLSKYQKLTIRKTPIETFQGKIVYTQTTKKSQILSELDVITSVSQKREKKCALKMKLKIWLRKKILSLSKKILTTIAAAPSIIHTNVVNLAAIKAQTQVKFDNNLHSRLIWSCFMSELIWNSIKTKVKTFQTSIID